MRSRVKKYVATLEEYLTATRVAAFMCFFSLIISFLILQGEGETSSQLGLLLGFGLGLMLWLGLGLGSGSGSELGLGLGTSCEAIQRMYLQCVPSLRAYTQSPTSAFA